MNQMKFNFFKLLKSGFKTAFILFLGICSKMNSVNAQSKITGKIMTAKDSPVAGANVLLLREKDSSLVKGLFSVSDGSYSIENIPDGNYLISFSFTGFKQTYSPSIHINGIQNIIIDKLVLTESFAEMNAVTVVSRKPLYEQKPDRTIINVQNSPSAAGSNALEVLERSPGVVVDRQNNSISLKGKDGVVLMIDGKMSYMSVAAAVEMLQGMSSYNIEKIELITAPPANFDAEGNAGYINIILKNNDHFGTNGSFAATLGYERGLVTEASLNFNHRNGKLNIYGNLSYSRVAKPLPVSLDTKFTNQGMVQETNFIGDRVDTTVLLNSRIGLDFQASKKTVFGILVTGYERNYTQSENNEVLMSKNNQLDSIIKESNSELNRWYDIDFNLNMQHDFSKDNKLSVNFDYIYYNNEQPVYYHTFHNKSTGDFVNDEIKKSTKSTPIYFWIAALDYSKRLGKNLVMDAGIKGTIADFSNELGFQRFNQGQWISDSSLTAKYTLNENYSAAYASFDWTIDKKTKAKMGLRYEYTNSDLGSEKTGNIIDRHYGNLFPVMILSRAFNENSSIDLSYNMRISRPTFNNLAPYVYYLDESTVITGNPALKASITNTAGLNFTFKKFTFSLSCSKEDYAISSFQPTVDSVNGKITLMPENVNQKLVSAILNLPIEVNHWWSMQYSLTGTWQQVIAETKDPLTSTEINFNINATQTFRFPKNISLELTGFYQTARIEGVYMQKAYGSLDAGIRKKLPGKKGAITISASNILNTADYVLVADHPERNLETNLRIGFTQPAFRLTYSRSFGNNKLKEKRERDTGAEDEKGRVQ